MKEILTQTLKQNKKIFITFLVSLAVCAILLMISMALSSAVSAQDAENNADTPAGPVTPAGNAEEEESNETSILDDDEFSTDVPIDDVNDTSALYDLIGMDLSEPIQVIILITLLSVAPSALIMLTSFTRIIIVLSFLRSAMQTNTNPPNMVLTGLALFLTIYIMWPVFSQINEEAYAPYANGEITAEEAIERGGEPLKTFMLKQTSNSNMKFFLDLQERVVYTADSYGTENPVEANVEEITLENYSEQLGFEAVIPAFIVSELTRAFQMGFMLYIPFLVIDIVVSSTLMSMGMMMLPPAMISMPFKILLFVLVDGWQMLVGTLVSSFNL